MLALIAGRGKLPSVLLENIADRNKRETGEEVLPFIASLDGNRPDFVVPDRIFRLEELGTLIGELQALGVSEVCFAGGITRPEIEPDRIDAATLPLVPRLGAALQKGDDGALREVLSIFEDAGMRIRAANEFASALLPVAGTYTARRLTETLSADIARAVQVLTELGPLDIGQSCVVHLAQVLAIEGKFGTDWMLESLVDRPDNGGGVFYKAAKPGQDRRVDLPVVGVDTVEMVKKAGLDAIVVEEDGVMVLDLAAVEQAADALGLVFTVHRP